MWIALALVSALVLIGGGNRERKAVLAYAAIHGLSEGLRLNGVHLSSGSYLVIDLLCLAGFVILSWKTPHPWPLWAAGIQLVAAMIQLLSLTNPQITPSSASLLHVLSVYAVLFTFVVGTFAGVPKKNTG